MKTLHIALVQSVRLYLTLLNSLRGFVMGEQAHKECLAAIATLQQEGLLAQASHQGLLKT